MSRFSTIDNDELTLLTELSVLMHPHQGENNYTNKLIKQVFNNEPITVESIFDLGKYYSRMFDLIPSDDDRYFLGAILKLKRTTSSYKNIKIK